MQESVVPAIIYNIFILFQCFSICSGARLWRVGPVASKRWQASAAALRQLD